MSLLEAQELTKIIEGNRLVQDVSLHVQPGEVVGVLGPNGSGKTTFLRMLATVTAPNSGELRLFGEKIGSYSKIRKRIGYVSDSISHFGDLTGLENAFMFAELYGLSKEIARQRIDNLFDYFELSGDKQKRAKKYSFGMKRKLAIIESMLHEPDILIMDEPTIGLDYVSERKMHELLKERAAQGACVILATNNVREAEALCDRVIFMHKGCVVADETPRKLIEGLGEARTINIELAEPIRMIPISNKYTLSMSADGTLVSAVVSRDPSAFVEVSRACVAAGGDIRKVEVSDTDLGAVFTSIVGEAVRW